MQHFLKRTCGIFQYYLASIWHILYTVHSEYASQLGFLRAFHFQFLALCGVMEVRVEMHT